MKKEKFRDTWQTKDIKQLTEALINHIEDKYYGSYFNDSDKYEKLNNRIFLWIAVIGLWVTLLIGLQQFVENKVCGWVILCIKIATFILPLISSFLLVYASQKGYKKKEQIRENARIRSRYIVNEARLRFSVAKTEEDYKTLYRWINEQIRLLQESQATEYFVVHNNNDKGL